MRIVLNFIRNFINESFPPKPNFKVEDIPDLTGKVVIVTGGNKGIGYETVKALLPKGAKVYMASRSRSKAEEAIAKLKEETGQEALFLELDLTSFASIRKATNEFISKESELHILFNNAGVMNTPIEQRTVEGYDLQFGTNVIGHYLFTKRLLPVLMAGARSSTDRIARVVNTSSAGHLLSSGLLDLDKFKDDAYLKQIGKEHLYWHSKFGNVVFSNELARQYGDKGIVSTSLNPGNIKTDLLASIPNFILTFFGFFFAEPPFGALTQLYAGVSPEGANFNGKYLIPWARVGIMRKDAADPAVGHRLWEWLERETGE